MKRCYIAAAVLWLAVITPAMAMPRVTCTRFGCQAHTLVLPSHAPLRLTGQVLPHPRGCPRVAFCGCGVSVKVFGRPVRSLYLAANWLRFFRRARPAAGRVAVRRGHVFYIEAVYPDGTVQAYDPNSGRHLTRRHRRSLAGYQVVDPSAAVHATVMSGRS